MGARKRYEYSPLEEIFFPKRPENSQYDENIDETANEKLALNTVKDNLLRQQESMEVCLKHKEKFLNTKHTNSIQNYFFFYEYRKCIFNLDGKLFIDKNPLEITGNRSKRDPRLDEVAKLQNYNTFIHAYNI